MAKDGEVKIKGGKFMQFKLSDNTWYYMDDLKSLWWLKFDDNYTIVNNSAVVNNEYYFSSAGKEHLNMKSVIKNRTFIPSVVLTTGTTSIYCSNHGLVLGEMITPLTTGSGFTAGTTYYVTNVVDSNNIKISTTYTTTNTFITPTASVTGATWYKKHGLSLTTSLVSEGMRSLYFDGGNHINGDFLSGTTYTDKILNSWSIYFFGRVNSTNQPFPTGLTLNMYIMSIFNSLNSNILSVNVTSTGDLIINYNGNILTLGIATTLNISSGVPWYILVRYDGKILSATYTHSLTIEYSNSINVENVPLFLNSGSTIITLGSDTNGLNCISKVAYDSFRFYDRYLTDEELMVLYNLGDGNNYSTFIPLYKYYDFYRWLCEEIDTSEPMHQIGYNGAITTGTLNLKRINDGTGVIVNQLENNIKCYKFIEENKGYLSSSIDFPAITTSGGYSISFWFKDTSTTTLKRRWISNSILSAGKGALIFTLGEDNSASNVIRFNVDNTEVLIPTSDWKNVWNLWTMVFNPILNITYLYKNTTLLGTVNDALLNPSAGLYIGGKNTTSDNEYITGFIRDIMIKPYILTNGEIRNIYNNGKPLNV